MPRGQVVTAACDTAKVGCELEFYFLANAPDRVKGEDILPLDDSRYCQSSSVDAAMEGEARSSDSGEMLAGLLRVQVPCALAKGIC